MFARLYRRSQRRMSVRFFSRLDSYPIAISVPVLSLFEAQRAPDLRPACALQRLSVVRSDLLWFAARGALRPLFVERFLGASHSAIALVFIIRYLLARERHKTG
jgi:hypothetical protein